MPAEASPAADAAPAYDAGPLTWVHAEIGQSLARAVESLAAFHASPDDIASLRQARAHVHQAAGAILMVGMDAVVVYTDEIERQLARLEETGTDVGAVHPVVDRACKKLAIFLDGLAGGDPPVPLKLFPEYEAMQRARGIRAVAPADLFFPDLDSRTLLPEAPATVAAGKLGSHLVKQRRLYEHGLLAFLRGDPDGARKMRDAVSGIERASSRQGARTFWWTVEAFFEAIVEGGLDPGFGPKQLAARIDLQIRRVVEGSTKVAERLRREVLYYVAVSDPVAPTVQAVQKGFGLAALIPSAETLNADVVRLHPILRDAREQLGAAKEMWLKVTTGRAESLPNLKRTLDAVHADALETGNAALAKLTGSLVARLERMPPSGSVVDSSPAIAISPAVGRSSNPMRLSSVVLPEPLGPISAANSPWRNTRSTPCRTSDSSAVPAA